jgi:hypothetical protein
MSNAIAFTPPPGCSGGVRGVPLLSGSGVLDLVPANAIGIINAGVSGSAPVTGSQPIVGSGAGSIFPTNGIWPTQNAYPPPGRGAAFGSTAWCFQVDATALSNLANNAQFSWLISGGWIVPLN